MKSTIGGTNYGNGNVRGLDRSQKPHGMHAELLRQQLQGEFYAKPSGREDACDGGSSRGERIAHHCGDVLAIRIEIGSPCIKHSCDEDAKDSGCNTRIPKRTLGQIDQDQPELQQK